MKLVYSHENMTLVHSAKNLLEINGIDCLLKNEHGNTMGGEFGITNLAEVWVVDADSHKKALEIIANKVNKVGDNSLWTCDDCHEENEGNFEICWKCQSARPSR